MSTINWLLVMSQGGRFPYRLALKGMCQTLIANTAYQNGRTEAGSRSNSRNRRPRRNDLKAKRDARRHL